jgi:extracellular factor (EF) 3-hydroxypalmitic acid methyl ester biosynthesis protein
MCLKQIGCFLLVRKIKKLNIEIMETNKLLAALSKFISQNGPTEDEYEEMTFIMNELASKVSKNEICHEDIQRFKDACDFLKDDTSIMGHIMSKPYGYAGDFHIIDRIYTNDFSSKFTLWDKFSLSNSAAQAVRNRKDYFKEKISNGLHRGGTLLNIASGPARDLFELYGEHPELKITTTCVDMDEKAIEYAKGLNKNNLQKITFIKENIFRFKTNDKFDLIWSAGLFDYFDDREFVLLIKKFRSWLNHSGEIIIGNFNGNHNPSRAYMELFGEWYLSHRTEDQLLKLAKQAGYADENISVAREPENVNLFLHLKV